VTGAFTALLNLGTRRASHAPPVLGVTRASRTSATSSPRKALSRWPGTQTSAIAIPVTPIQGILARWIVPSVPQDPTRTPSKTRVVSTALQIPRLRLLAAKESSSACAPAATSVLLVDHALIAPLGSTVTEASRMIALLGQLQQRLVHARWLIAYASPVTLDMLRTVASPVLWTITVLEEQTRQNVQTTVFLILGQLIQFNAPVRVATLGRPADHVFCAQGLVVPVSAHARLTQYNSGLPVSADQDTVGNLV